MAGVWWTCNGGILRPAAIRVGTGRRVILCKMMTALRPIPHRLLTSATLADAANEALVAARLRDPFGHQLHTLLAMAYLLLLPLKSTPGDIAFGLLLAWTCVRLMHTWRSYRFVLRSPVVLMWFAWAAWQAISLLWSSDMHKGLDELGSCRVLLLPFMLWPVLDRLPWLIASALLGVFVQNCVQGLQAIGWMAPRLSDPADRFAGLTHGIKTATWCCAAMCWNLSTVLHASSWKRGVSLALFIAAAAGLVLSGSRGPWIAAAMAVPLMLLVVMFRRPQLLRTAGMVLIGGLIASGIAWPLAKTKVMPRIEQALSEFQKAWDEHMYWTSVGLRIEMWRWSGGIIREHPAIGVGAGGFNHAKERQPDFQQAWASAPNESRRNGWLAKDHPHSMTLYALTCTGLVGGTILLLAIGLTLRQTWRDRPDHVFVDGMFFALLAWLIGAQFDTYNLNGQLFGMIGVIVAVTLPLRPAIRLALSAKSNGLG